jgi:hypothetical protein
VEQHQAPRDSPGFATKATPVDLSHPVENVRGQHQVEMPIGEIQALQGIAYRQPRGLAAEPGAVQ